MYRPSGNSGGRFGNGYWYFYPHENPDAGCLPDALPGGWKDAIVVQPGFRVPLAPKQVSPITISYMTPGVLQQIATGHFSFHLPTEVQGGIRLTLPQLSVFRRATARILLSEQLNDDGSVRVPMYTGATFISNFSLVPGAELAHHEYMNWRFGEIIFTDQAGQPIAVDHGDFNLSAWVVHYPYETARATVFTSSSTALDAVWRLNQNSVRYLGLDFYSDSNARQRSDACQADATTASQAQFATTAELAMPRQQMQVCVQS